ncbi:hypothetical protein BDA99DRAFT_544205 [Phascolomyces articulosus]|uniref:Uncharacterized protein n=1 Tax=Phascolomyces articulosus TaxID=60185 RepID=A0AAD5P6Z9_9FUNG|nr:hypothetical protein BDA99DRAFT_544205 [Phascolomyces articulosus]
MFTHKSIVLRIPVIHGCKFVTRNIVFNAFQDLLDIEIAFILLFYTIEFSINSLCFLVNELSYQLKVLDIKLLHDTFLQWTLGFAKSGNKSCRSKAFEKLGVAKAEPIKLYMKIDVQLTT